MNTDHMKHEFDEQIAHLKTLRDEMRVKLHLASMDAKTAFTELEHQAEHLSREVNDASRHALSDITTKLKKLAETFTGSNAKA